MLQHYKTVAGYGEDVIVIERSRFIGYAQRVTTEEEATAFIAMIKKRHWDATHNCSAFIMGENDQIQRSSDDGEPSGTAGKPILECIKKNGVKDTVVVVTRYFGGIKLGAGGLVRAYTAGTVTALKAAGIVAHILHQEVIISLDYHWWGKVENELRLGNQRVASIDYADTVTVRVQLPQGEETAFIERITDLTNGKATLTLGTKEYVELPVEAIQEDTE
ncbi:MULTISPECIES: YigZ family protein [Brevibacillus]|uniref:YigZ family protein n=1 Tax=Brevibacillus TaxID=55080 RepID=UPI000E2F383A|nr:MULTISPECIES: YigZ family protein [Brevibacillus]MCG7315702.1 YigZ family protein [Brevibacillus laterosporus]MED1786273.1 YigZ family protein [Brevibacillus laterosporus]RFB36048.1 YigZ family protein [Brevibacillus sp. VP]